MEKNVNSIFINRHSEREALSDLINKNTKINIIFSNEGFGKTALLENYLTEVDSNAYIKVNTDDLFVDHAHDYYFITKIISSISQKLNLDFYKKEKSYWEKNKSNLSLSLNIGPIGIGYTFPQDYKVKIDELIEEIKLINNTIYIHIENIQKIDYSSLHYIIRLINETDNVMFFLECSNDSELCYYLKRIFLDNKISTDILSIKKLEWSHVSLILKNLNLIANSSVKNEYNALDGNIKKLIFNNSYFPSDDITLDTEQQFVLEFIKITGTELSVIDIHNTLIKYNPANRYLFSLHNLRTYLKSLLALELVAETTFDYYYITEKGIKFSKNNKTELIVSILSNYYLPIVLNDASSCEDMIKGLRLLINVYLRYNDLRILKLIPHIEPNLLLLNGNKETIDRIYSYLKQIFEPNVCSSMLIIARSYIKLNCYNEAKDILDKYITTESNFSIILYAIILIHMEKDTHSTESYIIRKMNETSDTRLKSALHTCLVSLYMQTKSIKDVLTYVNSLKENELKEVDYNIIQKNISIYFNNNIALNKLNDSYKYFKKNNYNRLAIATVITLATKYAQSGKIDKARNILIEQCNNKHLSMQDLIYIDNNISVMDLLESKVSEKTINKFKEAYSFCKDHYTRLLIANNILIYYVQVNNLEKALLYVNEIEENGLNIYNFDDYLHLTYLNLRFYYEKIGDETKTNHYNLKLKELQKKCDSKELMEYISAGLSNKKTLNTDDRWFFMSSYRYRPAFVGHWIINDFDC